jgi:hypothetical protein
VPISEEDLAPAMLAGQYRHDATHGRPTLPDIARRVRLRTVARLAGALLRRVPS